MMSDMIEQDKNSVVQDKNSVVQDKNQSEKIDYIGPLTQFRVGRKNPKYEYKSIEMDGNGIESFLDQLNDVGEEGWELVTVTTVPKVVYHPNGNTDNYTETLQFQIAVLKRELIGNE